MLHILNLVTVELFSEEMEQAIRTYDFHIVCIEKSSEEFRASLVSLMIKAIKAFESRGPQLRHGIALDKHMTVILSQSEGPRPLCGIYFNLHSPYQKTLPLRTAVQPQSEPVIDGRQPAES